MRVLAVLNQKGGVGKTTLAVALAAEFARRRRRVLVVDLDPQANASLLLTGSAAAEPPDVGDVLLRRASLADVIRPTSVKGVSLAPALPTLGGVGVMLATELSRDIRLRSALAAVDDRFDLVVIDSPPTAGTLSVNAAVAASEVLVPVEPCVLAVAGLVGLEALLQEIREAYAPGPRLAGIVLSKVQKTATARAVEAELRARYGDAVLKAVIPYSAAIPAAHAKAASVLDDTKSHATAAFRAIALELDHGAEQRASQEGRRRGRPGVGPAGAPGHAA